MMSKIALVVVDMQPKYLSDIPIAAQEGIIAGITDVICAGQNQGMSVAVVEYADSGRVRNMVATLPRRNRRLITKSHCSAFRGTSLGRFLRSHGVDTIVVAGVHASFCIRETAIDAIEIGYRVVTAPDLIADNPMLDVATMWKWYGKHTTFYAHSAELCAIEIG
jgi:nicotinamidase-related amidase